MDNRPIGIFDSGLGGLTCVRKVMEIMPGEDIIYFGDTGRVPYGTRSPQTVVKYVRQDINFLRSFDIKFIIIACGTASSAALPAVAGEFDTKMTGVLEPTAQKAVHLTKNKKIGVIGTAGTINSGRYLECIKALDPAIEVYRKACPMFVPLVENGYTHGEVARLIAEEYLLPMRKAEIDTLILGCTHYPLLRDIIHQIMGDGVTLVDAGAETAMYAKTYLAENQMLSSRAYGSARYYVSDSVSSFTELGSIFLEQPIDGSVNKVEIEKY